MVTQSSQDELSYSALKIRILKQAEKLPPKHVRGSDFTKVQFKHSEKQRTPEKMQVDPNYQMMKIPEARRQQSGNNVNSLQKLRNIILENSPMPNSG